MAKKKLSPLAAVVSSIKNNEAASLSPSTYLEKIINDFCLETVWDEKRKRHNTKFDVYLANHAADMMRYIDTENVERKGRWRASAAGKCMQQQAFEVVQREHPELFTKPQEPIRPARQMRALFNGTFGHVRWHMLFDALHEDGRILTISAEERRFTNSVDGGLSGTQDRLIEFTFAGETLRAVIDFKTMRDRYFKALVGPQEDHIMQHVAYDELGYDADFALMLYEDKDNHDIKVYLIKYSELLRHKLIRNYELANKWVEQFVADVPKEERVKLPLTVTWCRYCAWQTMCLAENPDLRKLQENGHDDDDTGI